MNVDTTDLEDHFRTLTVGRRCRSLNLILDRLTVTLNLLPGIYWPSIFLVVQTTRQYLFRHLNFPLNFTLSVDTGNFSGEE